MLSRLSGLANTVLQELSGEGEDAEAAALPAGPELDPRQQNGEEVPEDVLERLAHMERLVVQLKDLVREKDAQLQQKEALLQEEKQAAEAKLLKLKLQAKAKLASLNKRIEELTERGGASPTKDPPGEPLPATKVQSDEGACHKWEEEMETLQRRLQEQEEMLAKLQRQLETTTGSLKEAQAQVSSLEKEIQKKGSLLEEQAHQHQAELRQLEARSALEAEMQQNLRLLQRKLEEQEAALLGRTQVVELLQQELNSVEEQKQVLLEQLQEAEAQLDSLSSTSASERQESQSLVERLELDLAEQKLASHRLQEEVQQLSQELTQARTPQADSECQRRVAEERHAQEMAEKNQEIAELQRAEEDLLSSYEAVRAETANAQQDADRPPECSTQDGSPVQQGELSERPKESGCSQAEPEVLTGQAAGQVSTLCEPVAEQDAASPRRTAGQDEQHQSVVEAANETICSKLAMLEKRLEFPAVAAASDQVSCAEIGLEGQSQVALRLSSGTDDSAAGPGDLLDGVGSARIGGLPLADVPAALAQASPCGSPVKPLAPENGPPDVLEYLSAKKHKDLSVLLLELEEAQEEIALLKGQLRDSSSLDPVGDEQPQGESRASDGGKGGEGAVLIQSDSSSSSLVTIEIQELFSPLPGTLLGQDGPCTEGREADQEPPSAPALHPQELAKLHLEIAELQARQQEAEELHQRVLEERAAEIGRLQQLAEGSGKALDTLRAERDQLLSQLKELCCLAELKEQVRQLEGDLADSEKRRLSDHESGISRLALLKEQLQSLKNEAKSKEVKIAALQKDLDESQQRLAEQELCGRRLSSQLQEEEQETRALAGRLKDTSAKAAELSQGLASKELEAARLERLLSERSAEIERLQQQAAEVSASLSDRMVQLSEEKFLLGKEVKSLTERLRLVVQGKQTREQGVGTEEEPPPEQPAERATPPSQEMETLRKENELVRKKLQAALASRKELLSKAHKLERELEAGGGLPGRLGASAWEACQVEAEEKPLESSGINADGAVHPARRGRAASLSQLLPAKEAQQQRILGEKESAVSALQAVVGEMQQSLQEKDLLISSLRAKLEDRCSAPEKQAPPASGQSSGVSGALAPPLAHGASGTTDCDPEGEPRSALEEKACALEQEREQLQKKLQEALASRKETIKKAQQKDRRHREQLKQQQDDYSLLQEQFDQQSREKERMQHQLQALSRTLEENSPLPPEDPALEAAQEPGQEVPAESAAASGSSPAAGDIAAVEQLKADLEKLRAEKGEAEAQVSRLEGELLRKSEAAGQLQEQVRQLLAEMETAKAACSQAETQVVSLRQELEETRAEVARQESLRLHQVDLEEQKEIASKEEIERLNSQLADKSESLRSLQTELEERAGAVKALQGQLEAQNKERTQHLEAEAQQKSAEEAAEHQTRAQVQRKLQAALISRKEVLKESKALKEELASTKAALGSASLRLSDAESRASELEKEKEVLLKKLVDLGEEREKLITEVDKALVENQNVSGSCESLKLALEGMTQEKMKLEEEVDSLRRSQAQELSEWQRKHTELQAEYETLLQSYENISNEAERIQRVVEGVRQEKQELFLKLKGTEAEKKEADARLQGAEQEMEGMREKMRKFAKSKQQKILELEEENERLRTEVPPVDGGLGGTEEMSTCLQEELEDSRKNCESLSSQLKELKAEKDSLNQQIQDLRQMVHSKVEVVGTSSVEEEEVAESEAASSTTLAKAPEATEAQVDLGAGCEPPSASFDAEAKDTGQASSSRGEMDVSLAQLAEQVAELEEKRRVAVEELSRVLRDVETLGEEKRGLEDLLTMKGQEVEALQEKVLAMEQANQQMEGELSGAMRLKGTLEAEKDDLEERLMNQLAELNGSIGNYQQDVADLQSQNQQLQAEVESLQGALSRLEDEKRHLLREKVEVEVEKKKEHVEKLKSTWKGDHGRAQAKELQELLKAKQQEVRQLQKGCIKSQEKASSLERSVKALEFVQSESQKELEAAKRSLAKAEEDTGRAQVELAACRVLLDDTRSEAARALAESLKVQEALRANKAQGKAQLREKERAWERRLEQEADKHAQALREAEERLETLQREQARSEGAVQGLRDSLRQKDQEAKQLQGSLNHTLAQLAAFSRSMSSLQDDRDRVIDQSRQWEKKFSEAIEKMEQEVHAREQACAALEEQAKRTAAQVEELQSRIASLEQSKLAQESSAQKELQRLLGEAELLQEEKRSLAVQLEEAQQLLGDSQKQMQKQETELRGLRERLAGLQDSFSKCQEERDQLGNTVRSREADLRESQFSREQLEADLQASKELTDRLHEETSNKDHQIIGLLAAKEEAVSAAVSELQRRHREERQALEGRISQAEEERTAVEAEKTKALERASQLVGKLKSAREESRRHKAQLDSFTKSMSSLQDDRDRVLEEYQQLERRHLAAILEKDQLIQEAASESNTLKEEIRSLHGQRDDLHAENAKLDAELVRYREDLQQLISIKDCQQKQLLGTQLERIQALEKEKAGVEGRLRESERALEALRLEKQSVGQEAEALAASLSRVQNEMAALQEGGPVLELQAQLQGKMDEVQERSGQLSLTQQRVTELQEELAVLRQSTAQQLQEAETKMKKELKSLHHDSGLMRNETETAEERVAELAKDLLEMEQSLLAVTEENQDLKVQIQSFRKAMSSLQDSWDQCNEELRALEKKYSMDLEEQRRLVQGLREENAQSQEEQKNLAGQRDALASELAALRDSVEEKGLLARLEKLSQQLQAKDVELLRLTAELEGTSSQVTSFSKAMASLQDERDRLLSELDKARRVEEGKLQSAAGTSSASLAEVPSLKKALSSLQSDRDRLLVELKNLQQQYLQVGVDTAEIMRLKAQLQEQKQEVEHRQRLQEQLNQEGASWQLELQKLREEKAAWELEAKGKQLSHVQRAAREERARVRIVEEQQHERQATPEVTNSSKTLQGAVSSQEVDADHLQAQLRTSLKELHLKEMRIQQLNSKLSQVFEEKNSLSLQLRGSSRNLRESHQHYSEVLARCEALEKQMQELQSPVKDAGSLPTDAAPGAPQERSEHPRETYTPDLQELQMKLSEAKQQQSSAKQGLWQLEEQLQEERDRRLAAEEAFSTAQDHIRRLESSEWAHPLETNIDMPPSPEHALLVGPADGSFSKARGATGLRRVLRSLCCSRRRLPLLPTLYLLTVHVLLLLCFTGHL